jgi:hypothetical protein
MPQAGGPPATQETAAPARRSPPSAHTGSCAHDHGAGHREQVATIAIWLNAPAVPATSDVHQPWTPGLPSPGEHSAAGAAPPPAYDEPKGPFGPCRMSILQFATQILQFS